MGSRYKCHLLEEVEADAFLESEHRQKALTRKGPTKNLGLFLRGELIGVLQVGPPRTAAMAKKYSAEIYRLAFKRGIRAPGGASKLIKDYIRLCGPSDFFTYQDTSGENTLVYHHSGMKLVKDGLKTKKQYLVAPGKTVETGSRREVLGLAYATRYGPDRILGTKLGEVLDPETGKRKSNKRLFLEELGWRLEETTGDSVWEWLNPSLTFYTYMVTASDSGKYYYGVSHVKKANASVEDCLSDGYYGSGGKKGKLHYWKLKHAEKLQKKVIGIYSKKAEAYAAEKDLIADSYSTDPNCLNSDPGGRLQPHVTFSIKELECEIHGLTKHSGNSCFKCVAQNARTQGECSIHGLTFFFGGNCQRCTSLSSKTVQECETHGLTKFQGNYCYKCMAISTVQSCPDHGNVPHYGGRCMTCSNQNQVSIKECETHGAVKHRGDNCYACSSSEAVNWRECPTHGRTKHRGKKCFKCRDNWTFVEFKVCSTHGESKHLGSTCMKCANGKNVVLKNCSVHGESKHRGDSCFKCNAAKRKKK